jgi:hypothetical protein
MQVSKQAMADSGDAGTWLCAESKLVGIYGLVLGLVMRGAAYQSGAVF